MEGGDGDRETHTHSKDRQMKEMEMMRGEKKGEACREEDRKSKVRSSLASPQTPNTLMQGYKTR